MQRWEQGWWRSLERKEWVKSYPPNGSDKKLGMVRAGASGRNREVLYSDLGARHYYSGSEDSSLENLFFVLQANRILNLCGISEDSEQQAHNRRVHMSFAGRFSQ